MSLETKTEARERKMKTIEIVGLVLVILSLWGLFSVPRLLPVFLTPWSTGRFPLLSRQP